MGLPFTGGGENKTIYEPIPTPQIEIIQSIYPEHNELDVKETPVVKPVNVSSQSGAILRPELHRVCACESGNRQFEADGSVRVSHTYDYGLCQINAYYHEEEATRLGMDIYTTEGNINYANHLFENEGYAPWQASRYCWDK